MPIAIEVDRDRLTEFCRRHHIRRLAFFGSVLRDDFGPDSDADVLVEFEPEHIPGLEFMAMEQELAGILGRAVKISTPAFLSPDARERVMAEAEEGV
jgi:predicted nucleotidyltransferase